MAWEGGWPCCALKCARCSPRWAWILQDALGIAFCLYMLKTIRLPTFKVRGSVRRLTAACSGARYFLTNRCLSPPQGCTLLLLVLFVYDVFFVFVTPYLTKV